MLERKLKQLGPGALRVAQTIALAGDDTTMELVAAVAGLSFDEVAGCLRELERQHLVQGRWFTSGAVSASVLDTMPEAVRATLTARIAEGRSLRRFGGLW